MSDLGYLEKWGGWGKSFQSQAEAMIHKRAQTQETVCVLTCTFAIAWPSLDIAPT